MDKDNRCPFYMGGDRCFASVGDEIRPEDMFGQREFRKCKPDAWTLVRCQQEAKRQEEAKDFDHPDFVPRPPQEEAKYSRPWDGNTISDGFGNSWPSTCCVCGQETMEVVRPGKVQCYNCDMTYQPPQEGEKDKPCCGVGHECDDLSSTGHCLGHPLCPHSVLDQRTGLPDRRVNEQPTEWVRSQIFGAGLYVGSRVIRSSRGRREGD